MCGIFARVNPASQPVVVEDCRRATELLVHRGPDAAGEWVSSNQEIYLGFRRLSILDLSPSANQPMCSPDGNLIIFNGEIFNYRDLREELRALGRHFRTTGDTEVLLAALEVWGERALLKLEGMFAFLFWDVRKREALVARDFFGIKPLYFWQPGNGGVAIASEVKSFFALADFTPDVNIEAIPEYMRFRCTSGASTLLKNVSQLQPGELLRYSSAKNSLCAEIYWKPADVLERNQNGPGDPEAQFRGLFRETVARHLFSDVPVGAQLSGGVDSTLSLAVAHNDLGRNIKGFHCSVEEPSCNESAIAQAAARHLGVELASVSLDGEKLFGLLEKLTWHMDEPLGHPNAIGVHLVSALARPEATVLISGEGADEIFGGYRRYSALLQDETLRAIPLSGAAFRALPAINLKYYREFKQRGEWVRQGTSDEIMRGMQFMHPSLLSRLLPESNVISRSEEARRQLLETLPATDTLTKCQLFDLATYLPPLLIRQDKMSMAASIENRVPFITPRMAEVGLNLPRKYRASWWQQKKILKRALTRYVPQQLVYRKKMGFGIPLNLWFRTATGGRKRLRCLRECCSGIDGYLDRHAVRQLIADYQGQGATAEALWIILSLAVWLDIFTNKRRVLAKASGEVPGGGRHPHQAGRDSK